MPQQQRPTRYHPLPRLIATPAQLRQLHHTHGHLFITTPDHQVRAWLGPGRVHSAPGPDLFGVNDLLDECTREFLRYRPRGGVFAVRWHTLRVVHDPREERIAEFSSPRDTSVYALGGPSRPGGHQGGEPWTATPATPAALMASGTRGRRILREPRLPALGPTAAGAQR